MLKRIILYSQILVVSIAWFSHAIDEKQMDVEPASTTASIKGSNTEQGLSERSAKEAEPASNKSQSKKAKAIASLLFTASLDVPATWLVNKAFLKKDIKDKYQAVDQSIQNLNKLLYLADNGKLLIKSYDVNWLIDQMTNDDKDADLINHRDLYERTFIYDLSIALMAYSSALVVRKDDESLKQTAEALAESLMYYIDEAGNALMVISTNGTPEGDQYSGNSAWVATALAYYSKITKDTRAMRKAELVALQLETLSSSFMVNQQPVSLVKGGQNYDWISTEHNIDYYFLIKELADSKDFYVTKKDYLSALNLQENSMIQALWNPSLKTFNRGFNDTYMVLDCSSWGAMFLLSAKNRTMATQAFYFAENFKRTSLKYPEVSGYSSTLEHQTVWLEGTVGVAMAALKLKRYKTYKNIKHEIGKLREAIGLDTPLLYSTEHEPDMAPLPSTAATGWNLILESMALSRYVEKHFMH